MSVPPANFRVFFFSDLVASTGRLSSDAQEISRHFTLTHQMIERFHGTVSNETGDGVLALFSSPLSAVHAALALIRALRDAPWNQQSPLIVRLGIHGGEVREIDGRLIGDAISFTQRVMSLASGSQILVSATVAEMLHHESPSEFRLLGRGTFLLKGFPDTERIYEVTAHDLPSNPLNPIPNSIPPNNLPRRLTSFVGRESEIEKGIGLISRFRLVTLTGIGGGGKTRLALEIGKRMLYSGREVRFASLGAIQEPNLLAGVIASALALPGAYDIHTAEELAAKTQSRHCLLILDNAEHLRLDCARLTRTLLTLGGEGLSLLVTSREALRIQGELVWQIPALSLPEKPTGILRPEEIVEAVKHSEAAQLFIERALLLSPDLTYTDSEYAQIGEIVRRSEGLPLAIELLAAAAGQSRLTELRDSNLLEIPPLPFPEHDHQDTISRSIEWSLNLLEPGARTLLARLWVFAGGFDREAAAAVLCDEELAVEHLSGLLDTLARGSLVRRASQGDTLRYSLPEAVRFYFAQIANLETSPRWIERHLRYYRGVAEAQEPRLRGAEQGHALDTLNRELDNLRAALTRAGHGEERLRLSAALGRFWLMQGYFTEGRSLLQNALLGTAKANPLFRAKALNWAGVLAHGQSDYAAAETHLQASRVLAEAAGSEPAIAEVYNNLGVLCESRKQIAEAQHFYKQSLALWEQLADGWRIVYTLSNLGNLASANGQLQKAEKLYRQALEIVDLSGDPVQKAQIFTNLATVLHNQHHYAEAGEYYISSLQIFQELNSRYNEAITLNNLAEMLLDQGNLPEARRRALQSLTISCELDDAEGMAESLDTCGRALADKAPEWALKALALSLKLMPDFDAADLKRIETAIEHLKSVLLPSTYLESFEAGQETLPVDLLQQLKRLDEPSETTAPKGTLVHV